jgi:lipopolysaccharide/colanic/teichoic acid biosynthesis glycosyltransferase
VTARGDGRSLAEDLTIDLTSVENLSLRGDLGILARTLPALLRDREDV